MKEFGATEMAHERSTWNYQKNNGPSQPKKSNRGTGQKSSQSKKKRASTAKKIANRTRTSRQQQKKHPVSNYPFDVPRKCHPSKRLQDRLGVFVVGTAEERCLEPYVVLQSAVYLVGQSGKRQLQITRGGPLGDRVHMEALHMLRRSAA